MIKFIVTRIKTGKSIVLLFLVSIEVAFDFFCRYMVGTLCEHINDAQFGKMLGLTAGMGILLFLVKSAERSFSSGAIADVRWRLRMEIETALTGREALGNDSISSGFKINVIQRETETVVRLIQRFLKTILPDSLLAFISILALFCMNPLLGVLGILCLGLPIPIVLFMSKANNGIYAEYYKKSDELVECEEGRLVNLELIKMLRLEQKAISEQFEKMSALKQINRKAAMKEAFLSIPTMILSFLTTIILGVAGGFLLYRGEIAIGQLVTIFLLVDCLIDPVMTLDGTITIWKKALVSKERISNLISEKQPNSQKSVIPEGIHSISIKNLAIFLPNNRILTIGNHEIRPGSPNIITGANGSGKSTLISLMMGCFDSYSGEVLFNEVNAKEIPQEELIKKVAVCTQGIMLFPCSISENLDMERMNDDEKKMVEILLTESGLKEEIECLQEGLNTVLNEKGEPLSKGQQQRLQIIRTVSKDADVYIFDEATASFGGSERKWFLDLVTQLSENKIVIWISHEKEYPNGSIVWEIGRET